MSVDRFRRERWLRFAACATGVCLVIATPPATRGSSLARDQDASPPPDETVAEAMQESSATQPESSTSPSPRAKSFVRPLPVRFQATVFTIDAPVDRIAGLDARALAAAATSAPALETSLKTIGTVRALYRVDQCIDLRSRALITISSSVPLVTMTPAAGSPRPPTVERQMLGTKFGVHSAVDPGDAPTGALPVSISVDISAMSDSPGGQDGVQTRVTRTISQSNGGLITLGRPVVLVAADGAGDGASRATAAAVFVTLIELSPEAP